MKNLKKLVLFLSLTSGFNLSLQGQVLKTKVPEIQLKLIEAIKLVDLAAVEDCLKNGADVKFVMPDGTTAISLVTKSLNSFGLKNSLKTTVALSLISFLLVSPVPSILLTFNTMLLRSLVLKILNAINLYKPVNFEVFSNKVCLTYSSLITILVVVTYLSESYNKRKNINKILELLKKNQTIQKYQNQ